jgi:DNA-binding LytR/AlgR family response regulator
MSAVGLFRPGLRVLIVDDELLARSRLRSLLGDCTAPAAATIADVSKAADAMDALVRERFDVVLLDIHMPGMDGLALAKLIKALPNPPAVVFVTAHTEHAVLFDQTCPHRTSTKFATQSRATFDDSIAKRG